MSSAYEEWSADVTPRPRTATPNGPRSSLYQRARVTRFEHGSRVPGWEQIDDLTKDPATVPDPALTPVPDDLRQPIEQLMQRYPNPKSAAIPALHLAQRYHGWCSPAAIEQVACVMRLTPAYLLSVASFYDMFALTPKPKHDVYVCTNISCSLLGADQFYEHMCAAAKGHDEIGVRSFECLGACDIGPMASVDGEYVGPLNLEDAQRIVDDLEAGRSVLEHKQLRHRAVADPQGRVTSFTEGESTEQSSAGRREAAPGAAPADQREDHGAGPEDPEGSE